MSTKIARGDTVAAYHRQRGDQKANRIMLSFKDIKRLSQETTDETQPEHNAIVAQAMTRFMVKVYELVQEQERESRNHSKRNGDKRVLWPNP